MRKDRQRSQHTATLTVVALDDRELLTTMGLALDPEAPVRVAETEPLETPVTLLTGELRRHAACGGTGGSLVDPRLWDLAINELYGTASLRHLFVPGGDVMPRHEPAVPRD